MTWEKITRMPFLAHSSYRSSSALKAVTSSALTMCMRMTRQRVNSLTVISPMRSAMPKNKGPRISYTRTWRGTSVS